MEDEKDLLLKEERAQRVKELLSMRKHDRLLGLTRVQVVDPLLSINLRIIEYVSIMPNRIEFLQLQTVQDFRAHYVMLQNKRLDHKKAVLVLRDEKQTKIYVDPEITKEQIRLEMNVAMSQTATIEERDKIVAAKLQCFTPKKP